MKLANGFEVDIQQDVLDDMELIEAIAEADSGSVTAVPRLVELLMGKENKKRLYDHIRQQEGKVRVTQVSACIKDIFEQLGEAGKKP